MMAIEQVLVGVNCVLTPLLCTFIVYTSDNGSIDTLSVSWSIVFLQTRYPDIIRSYMKLQGYPQMSVLYESPYSMNYIGNTGKR